MAQKVGSAKVKGSVQAFFTLPASLLEEVERYAKHVRDGDKSGFVAEAIRAHIERLRKEDHAAKLRASYAAAAEHGRRIGDEWSDVDDEMTARLDAAERSE